MANGSDTLAKHAAANPDGVAIIEDEVVLTFDALNRSVNRLASGLRALGAGEGEPAAWCGPNSLQVLTFAHAARKAGLVAVPVPYRFTAEEMHHVLADSGARVVVVDAEQAALVASIRHRLPDLRLAVVHRGHHGDFVPWSAVLEAGTEEEPPSAGTLGSSMTYTSGTTGRPKGAVRSSSDAATIFAMLQELGMGSGEVHLAAGPLYHSGPNAFALLTHVIGGAVIVMRRFDPAAWLDLVGRHRVTSTFLAPTALRRIVGLPDEVLADRRLSSMRTLIANAAPVPYALKREVIEKLGDGFLYEIYGSTELGVDTVLRPEDQLRKPGSCGRPYGGIQVKVVDDDGREVPPGTPGELYVRTPLAIDRYHGMAEQLEELDGGWKSVGDVAELDAEGYVYIRDRKTDMIITGGVNVYPAEVEAALLEHPHVVDAAVFGVPDPEWGERVHAVIQPAAGVEVADSELAGWAATRLAGYKRPRSWESKPQLPRTESGKLLKRLLREEHVAGTVQSAQG